MRYFVTPSNGAPERIRSQKFVGTETETKSELDSRTGEEALRVYRGQVRVPDRDTLAR
jgi:hypothetical protein